MTLPSRPRNISETEGVGTLIDTLTNETHRRMHGRLVNESENVLAHNAKGDGVTDDTVAFQSAIDETPAGATLFVPGPGTYMINQLTLDKRIRIQGDGKNITQLKAVSGATGPLINWNNSTLRPGCGMSGLTFDMTNATSIACLYFHNVRNGYISDLYLSPAGTVALQLDLAQGMLIDGVDVFNSSVAAYKGTHASSSGNNFTNCFSDNTTTTGVDGFYFDGGIDWWCIGCRVFRAPGSATSMQYGFRWNYTVENDNATGLILGCSADAMTDGTSSSTTVAGIKFKNVANCNVKSTFVSCAPVTDATNNTCIELDDAQSITIDSSYLSGQGVKWTGGVSDRTTITPSNRFYQPSFGTAAAMFNVAAITPTNLDAGPNDIIFGSSAMPITDTPSAFYPALTFNAARRHGQNVARPSTEIYSTFEVDKCTTNATALTSGTLYLFGIYLPRGLKVTTLSWAVGNTPLTLGTTPHYWMALYDSSKNLLRQSTDDTAASITANSIKSSTLSSSFTTTYDGLHYIGVMSNHGGGAGANPTYSNYASLTAITGFGTVRNATADTGLVGTAPNPAGATTNIGNRGYASVS